MAQLWGLKDVPRSTLLEKLGGDEESSSEGDEFQIVYIFIVACWEIRYVDPNAAIFKTGESLPSACANTFKKCEIKMSLTCRVSLCFFSEAPLESLEHNLIWGVWINWNN